MEHGTIIGDIGEKAMMGNKASEIYTVGVECVALLVIDIGDRHGTLELYLTKKGTSIRTLLGDKDGFRLGTLLSDKVGMSP